MAKERIGFVGVGLMGHGMAKSLIEKGYGLTILGHRNRAPVEDLVQRGAKEAKSAEEVARNSDIVFLCVTGSPEVEAVVRGPKGLKAGAHKGMIVVDTSTSDPNSTIALAAELASLGVSLCDAPLGGTPAQAQEGKLSTMVGCGEAIWARLEPVLGGFAQKSVRVGCVGDGHKMKLMMNFLAMGYAAIYSEALSLGAKSGLTPQKIDSVLRGSRMDCGFYQTFFSYVLDRNRDAHKFTLKNALKDMNYLASMAQVAGVTNPVGAAVRNSYAAAIAAGKGEDYVPMLSDFIAAQNGAKLTD
jgi:3-hydroxyisobutyrate dehydrogenase-like beta-hydroxyacid dehydrogenase